MISYECKGNYSNTFKYLKRMLAMFARGDFNKYGRKGVEALMANTPTDTGRLKNSWYYDVKLSLNKVVITWCNSDIEGGVPVALILQYGHATKNGGWVEGIDYINPAMQPIFELILKDIIREVKR